MKNIKPVIVFLGVAAVVSMMAATIVGRLSGSAAALDGIYHSWWFISIWALLLVAGIIYCAKTGMPRRPVVLGMHLAMALIIAGALVTHFFSTTVKLRIYENETNTELPFAVTLKSFDIVNYPGTHFPADYVSVIEVDDGKGVETAEISMNHVYRKDGYRFFLSGYDEFGTGVAFTVSHDPWGTGLVYAGYILLLLSMIGFFLMKYSNFRSALYRISKLAPVVLFLLFGGAGRAYAAGPKVLPEETAASFDRLYVYYNGRIAPFRTVARDYVMKAYGKPHYKDYTAEQVFVGWMLDYDSWKDVPLKKKNVGERRAAVVAVASGNALKVFPYKGSDGKVTWYSSADRLPADMDDDEWNFIRKVGNLIGEYAFEKDYEAIENVVAKIAKYQHDKAGEFFPSSSKTAAEEAYNSIGRPFVPAILSVMIGIILFILACFRVKAVEPVGRVVGIVGFVYLTVVLALRWYVSGHIPMANGFEMMMIIGWAACLSVMLAGRKFSAFRPMGVLLAGFAMLVAALGESNPKIGPLVPALSSPFLSIHVSCMMFAYTLFGLLALCGVMGLAMRDRQSRKAFADRGLVVLYPALFLMIAGTVIGSVWANVSWGSYWSWDPKETWSLITIIVYSMPMHPGFFKFLQKPERFHLFCILAFITVLFTYFGVNFLLGGMHSYAG